MDENLKSVRADLPETPTDPPKLTKEQVMAIFKALEADRDAGNPSFPKKFYFLPNDFVTFREFFSGWVQERFNLSIYASDFVKAVKFHFGSGADPKIPSNRENSYWHLALKESGLRDKNIGAIYTTKAKAPMTKDETMALLRALKDLKSEHLKPVPYDLRTFRSEFNVFAKRILKRSIRVEDLIDAANEHFAEGPAIPDSIQRINLSWYRALVEAGWTHAEIEAIYGRRSSPRPKRTISEDEPMNRAEVPAVEDTRSLTSSRFDLEAEQVITYDVGWLVWIHKAGFSPSEKAVLERVMNALEKKPTTVRELYTRFGTGSLTPDAFVLLLERVRNKRG